MSTTTPSRFIPPIPTSCWWAATAVSIGRYDRAQTFQYAANLPLTQFYKVDVDYDEPFYNVVGGTQDNNTLYGPSRTDNRFGHSQRDWRVIIGGDGHDCAIDPTNPNIIYCESQQGFLRRYDRRTGRVPRHPATARER